jgi:hypothetical protein
MGFWNFLFFLLLHMIYVFGHFFLCEKALMRKFGVAAADWLPFFSFIVAF